MTNQTGALRGLKIIDLSRVLGGPYCSQALADHGAEVIKLEPSAATRPVAGAALRGRHGVLLQGREPQQEGHRRRPGDGGGHRAAAALAGGRRRTAGELQARHPGALGDRLRGGASPALPAAGPLRGIGLRRRRPARRPARLRRGDPGDGRTDERERRGRRRGVAYRPADRRHGHRAERHGRHPPRPPRAPGQRARAVGGHRPVRLRYLPLHPHLPNYFASGRTPRRSGNAHPNIAPYDSYRTGTEPIFLAVGNDRQFARLCEYLGADELPGTRASPTTASARSTARR